MMKKGVWWFFAACIVLAVVRGVPDGPNGWVTWAEDRAAQFQSFVSGAADVADSFTKKVGTPSSILKSPDELRDDAIAPAGPSSASPGPAAEPS